MLARTSSGAKAVSADGDELLPGVVGKPGTPHRRVGAQQLVAATGRGIRLDHDGLLSPRSVANQRQQTPAAHGQRRSPQDAGASCTCVAG